MLIIAGTDGRELEEERGVISQAMLRPFSFSNWTMERRPRVFSFTYVFVGSESYIEQSLGSMLRMGGRLNTRGTLCSPLGYFWGSRELVIPTNIGMLLFGFPSLQLLLSPLHRDSNRELGTSGNIILAYSHEPLCLKEMTVYRQIKLIFFISF